MEVGQFKIGAIIQARLGSTRLPNKVLMPLPLGSNETILSQIIKKIKEVDIISDVINKRPGEAPGEYGKRMKADVLPKDLFDQGRSEYSAIQVELLATNVSNFKLCTNAWCVIR